MIRLIQAALFLIKGLCLKLFSRKSVLIDGVGRISMKAEFLTRNGGVIEVGKNVRVCEGASISADGGRITLGEKVFLNRGVILRCHGRIEIGEGTLFAPNVSLFDHNHRFDVGGVCDGYSVGSIKIGKKCWIGANATILKNTQIGDGCVIGAGCVVSGVIPAHSLVTSNRDLLVRPIEPRDP